MVEGGPPVGLSEDEAYEPPGWARVVLVVSIIAHSTVVLALLPLGVFLVLGMEGASGAWEFWGDTTVLGGAFLVTSAFQVLGLALLARRSDGALVSFNLGTILLAATALWSVVTAEASAGTNILLLLLLLPFLGGFGVQSQGIRRWWFQDAGDDADPE